MDIESIRNICNALPFVTEDIKWVNDLCFLVGEKMFCVAGLTTPLKVSLKVTDEEFDEISNRNGIKPAPYVARYKWILVEDINVLTQKQWEDHIRQSYDLVKAKLPKNKLP
ncbi:MAG: MmcQ/YjbR family DNA-binding protein [Bacteroidota bacterium]|nr:MmcQ/YjbR family DNA-binding protein [Bacteroidota bacterium]